MRTNTSGFALTVGMALIVLLLGFGALSAAGLVGFSADEALAEKQLSGNKGAVIRDTVIAVANSYVPASAKEADAIKVGDPLFKANCTQCHAVNEKVVGPALAGITKRRSIQWVVSWIHNSAKVVASGDDYAVKIFNEHGQQQMPSFPNLSRQDIESIVAWVHSQEGMPVDPPLVVQ